MAVPPCVHLFAAGVFVCIYSYTSHFQKIRSWYEKLLGQAVWQVYYDVGHSTASTLYYVCDWAR